MNYPDRGPYVRIHSGGDYLDSSGNKVSSGNYDEATHIAISSIISLGADFFIDLLKTCL